MVMPPKIRGDGSNWSSQHMSGNAPKFGNPPIFHGDGFNGSPQHLL